MFLNEYLRDKLKKEMYSSSFSDLQKALIIGTQDSFSYHSYLETVVYPPLLRISGLLKKELEAVMLTLARLHGQQVSAVHMARFLGLKPAQLRGVLNFLIKENVWTFISSYGITSLRKKYPLKKGYFTDSGLVCYLLSVTTPHELVEHHAWGALFEGYAIQLIRDDIGRFHDSSIHLYYWRTYGGEFEVDLVIARQGQLIPIEIKARDTASLSDGSGIAAFVEAHGSHAILPGIICFGGRKAEKLSNSLYALPLSAFNSVFL